MSTSSWQSFERTFLDLTFQDLQICDQTHESALFAHKPDVVHTDSRNQLVSSQIRWQVTSFILSVPTPHLVLASCVYFAIKLWRISILSNDGVLEQFQQFIFRNRFLEEFLGLGGKMFYRPLVN